MKDCEQFQLMYASSPQEMEAGLVAHADQCPDCASFADAIRELDNRLIDSMKVNVPADLAPLLKGIPEKNSWIKSKWTLFGGIALAASVLLSLGLSLGLRLNSISPSASLRQAVYQHILGEPQALTAVFPVQPAVLNKKLKEFGVSLGQPIGDVMYVKLCPVGDSRGLHLVVQGKQGPVTLLILPAVNVTEPINFIEGRFVGYMKQSAQGVIAVVGEKGEPLQETEALVNASLTWL